MRKLDRQPAMLLAQLVVENKREFWSRDHRTREDSGADCVTNQCIIPSFNTQVECEKLLLQSKARAEIAAGKLVLLNLSSIVYI